ncbi:synaptogyrin-2b [Tachysurus fulvidraco]|uniref:synaptogyrin-2b n=1 Tax=Tachysurus fulvidraco TaxID=1234273 RepID=UPI000F507E48|nr:synaptogyrin-2b [Tachysurus fulvidraco]
MESRETTAYGASLAGGSFDFVKFIKQPLTILRILNWVFAIVVFATIVAEGYVNDKESSQVVCIFNQNDGACNYGAGIGVIAFLATSAFIFADAYLPLMSSAQERKRLVMADMAFSGLWTFLWFVCFCLLANQWTNTIDKKAIPVDAAQAIIVFSFFSFITWGVVTYLALMRFRQGVGEMKHGFAESAPEHNSPYQSSTIPHDPSPYGDTTYPSDLYQQPPFVGNPEPAGNSTYQPPTY